MVISDEDRVNYMQILAHLNKEHAKFCITQKELSESFKVSIRTISSFKQGTVIDFWLLSQYAAIIGLKIGFFLMSE